MADAICRTLRDGALEGEQAPALTIKDTIASPLGSHVFGHVLSQLSSSILAGKGQSRGLVIVAFSRSPSFYVDSLKRKGVYLAADKKWFCILDCYTDPLGWKVQLMESGTMGEVSGAIRLCKDVKDLDKFYSLILELGKGLVGQGNKDRFSVAIDSVSEMLRHGSVSSVAGLLSNIRGHDRISSVFWVLHSDLHEVRISSVLEYISSMVASVEPLNPSANGWKGDSENSSLLEQNLGKGKFHVRLKRRNGRVRVMCEEFYADQLDIKFSSVSSEEGMINQGPLPKVQFNLQLSEKERIERAKVVLPFEHQGNGKTIQIYDGRRSLAENKHEVASDSTGNPQRNEESKGEIIYYRDSDDEMPDSDEDPDDDLDI